MKADELECHPQYKELMKEIQEIRVEDVPETFYPPEVPPFQEDQQKERQALLNLGDRIDQVALTVEAATKEEAQTKQNIQAIQETMRTYLGTSRLLIQEINKTQQLRQEELDQQAQVDLAAEEVRHLEQAVQELPEGLPPVGTLLRLEGQIRPQPRLN